MENYKLTELVIDKKLMSRVKKDYGHVLKSGLEHLNSVKERHVIGISPAHDSALKGGLKEGHCVCIGGMFKQGKTTTCLQILANAQKPENGSRHGVFVDVECRLKDFNITGIKGLDPEKLEIIRPDGKVIHGEDYLNIIESLLRDNEKLVIVVDSLSELISKSEAEGEISGDLRAKMPKILKNFFKRVSPLVDHGNHILIFVNQMIADMGRSMKTRIMDGGWSVQFKSDTTLEITHTSPWVEDDKIVGQFIHWKVTCSVTGGLPGTKYTSAFRYGEGLDSVHEFLETALELSIIEKSGSWFESKFFKGKIQGQAKLTAFLKENPDVLTAMQNEIVEVLK